MKTEFVFNEWKGNLSDFLQILPPDWIPFFKETWDDNLVLKTLYSVSQNNTIVAGGLVINGMPKDTEFSAELLPWVEKGYRYIGFLCVSETMRNQQLGSFWLQKLRQQTPNTNYWLTVEEEGLIAFYIRNGFTLIKELENEQTKEWLLVDECG